MPAKKLIGIYLSFHRCQKIINLAKENIDRKVLNPHHSHDLAETVATKIRALLKANRNEAEQRRKKKKEQERIKEEAMKTKERRGKNQSTIELEDASLEIEDETTNNDSDMECEEDD